MVSTKVLEETGSYANTLQSNRSFLMNLATWTRAVPICASQPSVRGLPVRVCVCTPDVLNQCK